MVSIHSREVKWSKAVVAKAAKHLCACTCKYAARVHLQREG